MDAFFLDEILHVLMAGVTNGYLAMYPWVQNLLVSLLTIGLLLGFTAVALVPRFETLGAMGALSLRGMALIAVAQNWNYIFDTLMKSLVQLGLMVGAASGSTMTVEEFLSPGRLLYLGLLLSNNLYLETVALGLADTWNPIVIVGYTAGYYAILLAFFAMAIFSMATQIEFALVSLAAFLAWPTMSVSFLAWIAWPLVQAVVGVSLRLFGLAVMLNLVLPFATTLALPEGELTFQSSVVFGLGCVGMAIFIWRGPTWVGASSVPGMSLRNLAMMSLVWFRRV